MGFRKRDEEAQRRRNIRANEIALEYANKKGITPTVMMASEMHTQLVCLLLSIVQLAWKKVLMPWIRY